MRLFKNTFQSLFAVIFLTLSFNASALTAGKDFDPVAKQINAKDADVIELFYYGCIHCYNLEPSLHNWLKTKPSSVKFKQVPAVLDNPNWIFMAKVYLTAEELGIVEKSHIAFFHALHRDKMRLFDLGSIAKFHSQFGASEQEFINTFESFKIDQKMRQAMKITQDAGISGVPSLIVKGKFVTDLTKSGSEANLWRNVNGLLAK